MSWLLISGLAYGWIYTVDCPGGTCTTELQNKLDVALANDEVLIGPGIYVSDSAHPFVVRGGVNLRSTEGAAVTVLKRTGISGPTLLLQGSSELEGLTVVAAQRAIDAWGWNNNWSNLVLRGTGHVSAVDGQGVYLNTSGYFRCDGCRFENLNALNGGAIYAHPMNEPTVELSNCAFTDNAAIGHGGAIYGRFSRLTLDRCRFEGNTATEDGGAIYGYPREVWAGGVQTDGSGLLIRRSTFRDNRAGVRGGHLAMELQALKYNTYQGPPSEISDSLFVGGEAEEDGGGAYFHGHSLRMTHNAWVANRAGEYGGAVFFSSELPPTYDLNTAEIAENAFAGNEAGDAGGALYLEKHEHIEVEDNAFSENVAGDGAALYLFANEDAWVARNRICDSFADPARAEGLGSAAVDDSPTAESAWWNNLFLRGTGAGAGLALDSGLYSEAVYYSAHNAFIGQSGDALRIEKGNLRAWNSLFAEAGGYGLSAGDGADVEVYNSAFWANGAGDVHGDVLKGGLIFGEDPGWYGDPSDWACAWPSFSEGTPLSDAGLPIPASDSDGTSPDIGPQGGPQAPALYGADGDGDGDLYLWDCDDADASVGPSATPVPYDGVDQDCGLTPDDDLDGDGSLIAADCDDTRADFYPGATDNWYDGFDANCDGADDFDADGDGHRNAFVPGGGDDCLDSHANVYPGAPELWYNGLDENCDGADDNDQDGDGDPVSADCDDTAAAIHLGAVERWYDGVDQDCDGADDFDQDGDGHRPTLFGGEDCDDADAARNPGVAEAWYDGIDGNCDGADDFDADGDGYPQGADCADDNAGVFPGGPDPWYDGVDGNCDEADDFDQDGDGYLPTLFGGEDCDDRDASVHPEAAEEWYDGIDGNCDGADDYDADGDGYRGDGGLDCEDSDAAVHPGVPEDWTDAIDQNCDGVTEPRTDYDEDGVTATAGDCDDANPAVYPGAAEAWYDGIDGNCDGADDFDADGDGYRGDGGPDCDDADAARNPGVAEVWYDGIDGNCDGADDFDADGDGYRGDGGSDCDDADAARHPEIAEVWYDGIDGNCDGADDFDADGDHYAAASHGGDDCADLDPEIHPDAFDEDADGIDQNCDGVGAIWVVEGGACANTGAASAFSLSWGALFALRRRRGPRQSAQK